MAIYHCSIKIISRGKGRSAVACAAYRSGTKLTDLATGKVFDYSNKPGVVFSEVLLPENAPAIFAVDRNILWDAVERKETHSAAQLAREVEVALPCEFTRQEQIDTVREYIMKNFVHEGMCADWALHDRGDGNPHAHIMLTMRAIKPNGKWAEKSRTIYKLDPNGQKIPLIDPETGEQKVRVRKGKGVEKLWQTEKVPANDWNDRSKAEEWRAAWAEECNRRLDQQHQIDHRSYARQAVEQEPTIHEGYAARKMEREGRVSDRCEINRQIKADSALLRELKAEVKKLAALVSRTVPAIAEGLEKLRSRVLIFCYQLRHIGVGKYNLGNRVKAVKPELERYAGLVQQIKEKSEERKKLLAEKKKTQFYQIPKLHDFTRRITELTEEIEELKTEKNFLLRSLNCADDADISDVKKEIATLEIALKKLDEQEVKYATELEDAMKQYAELNAQVADMDAVELKDARLIIRPDRERSATDRIKAAYGEKYDPVMMHDSKRDVANLLNEETGARSVRNLLRQTQKMQQMQQRREPKRHERER